jgi:aminocarboxymuconate-semialdehyde decarboxylase
MIVDAHCHLIPPRWAEERGVPPSLSDEDGFFAAKERAGIEFSIVSSAMLVNPRSPIGAPDVEAVREYNAFAADLVARRPGRIRFLTAANPLGGDEMLEEVRSAVEDGGFVGITVHSSVGGEYLDGPGAADFWALADELAVPVFLHPPNDPPPARALRDRRLAMFGGRYADVALGLAALLMGGVLGRWKRVRLVGASAGGGLAMLAGRLDVAQRFSPPMGPPTSAPQGERPALPSAYLDRVFVDTCVYSGPALACTAAVLGTGHMLFGTDFPPVDCPPELWFEPVEQLGLVAADRERVLGGNALALYSLGEVAEAAPARSVPN